MVRLHAAVWCVLVVLALRGTVCTGSEPATEAALRATVRIHRAGTSGTGFVVTVGDTGGKRPRHVLVSAAHVFDNLKGADCTVVFRARGKDGVFVRKDVTVPMRQNDKPLWVRHPQVDVAVLPLSLPDGVDVQPFAVRQLADANRAAEGKVRVGQDVYIPCFPVQLESNPAGWPILRKGTIASHPLTPLAAARTVYIDYSHFGGDSGAPVVDCSGGEPVVVALVSAMQRQTEKMRLTFEERTIHTPLGLAICVQAPFLRETVDLLLKK